MPPAYVWGRQIASDESISPIDMALDPSGNIYFFGSFRGTVAFGPTTLKAGVFGDGFLAKADPNGTVLWAKKLGLNQLVVDSAGDLYLCGTLGAALNPGTSGGTVAKLNPDGGVIWISKGDNVGSRGAFDILVDAQGNSYITGSLSSLTVVFGSITLHAEGQGNAFVAKLDPQGNYLWATQTTDRGATHGRTLDIDAAGNLYVGGYYTGQSTFGQTTLMTRWLQSGFVAKADASGAWVWARIVNNELSNVWSLDVDPNRGTVYSTGSVGFSGAVLVRWDSDGNPVWTNSLPNRARESIFSVTLDPAGDLLLAGGFPNGTVKFGQTTITNLGFGGFPDVFVGKVGTTGDKLWAIAAGEFGTDIAARAEVNASGDLIVVGSFQEKITFGTNVLTAPRLDAKGFLVTHTFIAKAARSAAPVNGFTTWTAAQFAGQSDPSIVGPTADPDLDGVVNAVEFAFGLSPTNKNDRVAPLQASIAPGGGAGSGLVLEFTRPTGLTGVSYLLEVSSDLATWLPLGSPLEVVSLAGGMEKVSTREVQLPAPTQPRFVRLAIRLD